MLVRFQYFLPLQCAPDGVEVCLFRLWLGFRHVRGDADSVRSGLAGREQGDHLMLLKGPYCQRYSMRVPHLAAPYHPEQRLPRWAAVECLPLARPSTAGGHPGCAAHLHLCVSQSHRFK